LDKLEKTQSIASSKQDSHRSLAWGTLFTCGFATFNYFAFYMVGIMLAKELLPADYGDYSAAVALATTLAALGTLGLDKLAVKFFPIYLTREKYELALGFWRFGIFIVTAISTLIAIGTIGIYETWTHASNTMPHPFAWILLFLPVMALSRYFIEVLTGWQWVVPSVLIYRGLLPLTAVVIMTLATWHFGHDMTSRYAVISFGIAWTVCLVVLFPLTWRLLPKGMLKTTPSYEAWKEWVDNSLGFLVNGLILTMLTNGVLLVLEIFHHDEAAVGVFGAVVQTSGFMILIATSTNRMYLPRLSKAIASGESEKVASILRSRLKLIAPMLFLALIIFFVFGERILDMFCHHTHETIYAGRTGLYAQRGYAALLVMVAGSTVSSMLATAPYVLMYTGHTRHVLMVLGAASTVALVAAVPLSLRWNEIGAASAYTVSISVAFLWIGLQVRRKFGGKGDPGLATRKDPLG